MNLTSGGTRRITSNTFTNIAASAIQFGQNAQISENHIIGACTSTSQCGSITNMPQDEYVGSYIYDTLDLNASISDNFIENTGLNASMSGSRVGIFLGNLSRSVNISNNTLSG